MTLTLGQLSLACPHQLWLEFSESQQKIALSATQNYSYEAALHRAFLNRLTLAVLSPEFSAASETSVQLASSENLWEFVTGFALNLGKSRLVIIPSETIDTDEFSVPQEWVDIPALAADYYLAVQVNLEDGWLRVWGFTTHRKLKTEGRYDAGDRTYSLDSEDIFENLNTLWVSQQLCPAQKAEIQPLPTLSHNQVERFIGDLGKPSLYSPRLKMPFAQWGALLAADNFREQLYHRRIGKESAMQKVVNLSEGIFPKMWLLLEELVTVNSVNFASARGGSRTGGNEGDRQAQARGRMIDLGIQLVGHPVALIVYFTPESNNKWNILLQIRPGGGQTYLPPEVQMIVLDDTGEVFLEARSRSADNRIQLEFSGEPGERFSVKVALGDASIVEDFVI
ncbi:MAG: DUF1822 family protein [Microcoleus anatoxicus]|uniref:DUF1822 family protein n=1 Tax=Microcoleus anatoxicus TaxID=2705319 RepID=UPI003670126C